MRGCEIGCTSMDRVLAYAGQHYWLATFAVVTGLAVLLYELYLRAQNVGAIAPQEAIRLMNQGATVIDLRPSDAYAAGHINGARNFDTSQILHGAETLKRYKEKPLIVFSDSSSIAAAAVRTLTSQGFTKVFNLRGGVAAWRAENLPLARD
jgi:rhodanese-related sulfurtransferase